MIKPLLVAGVAAACLSTPVFAQVGPHKMKMGQPGGRPTTGQYIPGGPGIYRPTHSTGYIPGGRGIDRPTHGAGYIPGGRGIDRPTRGAGYIPGGRGIYRPTHGTGYIPGGPGIYRPASARQTTFAGGYGYRRGFGGAGYGYAGSSGYTRYGYTGASYGSTNIGGYGGGNSYGYGSGYGSGYGNGGGYGYGQTVSAPASVGYGVASTLGAVGYATVGQAGSYGYGAYQAAQPNAVVTTAYVPVLTYRPIKVIYTPQTPPYYNTPHYLGY